MKPTAPTATFDLERLRHNWDRAATPPNEPLPPRFLGVLTPRDPMPEAERLLARIRRLADERFGAHKSSLEPFLNEAFELLEELKECKDEEPGPLRKKFLATLDDLQDLFEVYAGIGLR